MQRNHDLDDFEQLLREKADQHRMHPSGKVWNNINNNLHNNNKRKIVLIALLFIIAIPTATLFNYSVNFNRGEIETNAPSATNGQVQPVNASLSAARKAIEGHLTPSGDNNNNRIVNSNRDLQDNKTIDPSKPVAVNTPQRFTVNIPAIAFTPAAITVNPITATNNPSQDKAIIGKESPLTAADKMITQTVTNSIPVNSRELAPVVPANIALPTTVANTTDMVPGGSVADNKFIAQTQPLVSNPIVETKQEDHPLPPVTTKVPVTTTSQSTPAALATNHKDELKKAAPVKNTYSNITGEEFVPQRIRKAPAKFSWGIYTSSFVSYRTLSDRSANQRQTKKQNGVLGPVSLKTLGQVEKLVAHRPEIGYAAGVNFMYRVNDNLHIRLGVQANYSRYSLKVHNYLNLKTPLSLNINGTIANDSIYSFRRSLNGYNEQWEQNQYVDISTPISVEMKVAGRKRLRFSVAGGLQPSYLVFNKTLQLSTDYLHYIDKPDLVRRWNLHGSFETILSYQVKHTRWQFGTESRVQLGSSYIRPYPIVEHLYGHGVKFGFFTDF
jgi:hypothetical protein